MPTSLQYCTVDITKYLFANYAEKVAIFHCNGYYLQTQFLFFYVWFKSSRIPNKASSSLLQLQNTCKVCSHNHCLRAENKKENTVSVIISYKTYCSFARTYVSAY